MKSKVVVLLTALFWLGFISAYGQLQSNTKEALALNNGCKIAVVPQGAPDPGTICIVWVKGDFPQGYIWYAESTNGGISWTSMRIDQAGGPDCLNPAIAIAPDGARCVVWVQESTGGDYLYFTYKKFGSWYTSPIPICGIPMQVIFGRPSIAVDNDSKIHISYHCNSYDDFNYKYICYIGGFTTNDISPSFTPGGKCLVGGECDQGNYYFGTSAIATDGSGHPLVIWQGSSTDPSSSFPNGVYYYFYTGTNWIPAIPTSIETGVNVSMPSVSGSGTDVFYGVWKSGDNIHFSIYNGIWSPIEAVNNRGTFPVVTAFNDNIIVAWEDEGEIYYSCRESQDNWSPPVSISNTSLNSVSPHITISSDDDSLYAIWVEGNSAPYDIEFLKIHKGVDLLIRDHPDDIGKIPSWDKNGNGIWDGLPTDYAYWISPDIWVDNDGNGVPDNPIINQVNHLYARVKNIGCQPASNTKVTFWCYAPWGIGTVLKEEIIPPPKWSELTKIGELSITTLNPGDTWTGYVGWTPSEPHSCIYVIADNLEDQVLSYRPDWENNIGQRNFDVVKSKGTPYGYYQAVVDFKVCNPDTIRTHDFFLDLFSEDLPSNWTVKLTSGKGCCAFACCSCFTTTEDSCRAVGESWVPPPYECSSSGGCYIPPTRLDTISATKYVFLNMPPREERDVTLSVTVPDGTENDTGTIHIAGTIDSIPIGGVSVQVVPPKPTNVLIAETDTCVNPGDYVSLPILLENNTAPFGGFELEVEFDYTAMTFVGAEPGELLTNLHHEEPPKVYSWEYFQYRLLPCPACPCCKYKILLLGMMDIPNGPSNVGVPIPAGIDGELVLLHFVVNNDENLRGFKIPVCWEWEGRVVNDTLVEDWDCNENTFSSWTGDTLFVSRLLCQYRSGLCDAPSGRIEPVLVFQNGICGQNCGGVDVCPAGPGFCKRGDINYNTLSYEVADAVLFASYFARGIEVFSPPDSIRAYQICATDVNADGRTLTLSDLVYLIRVILHDAPEIPQKLAPSSEIANVVLSNNTITTECANPIGAILFEFDGGVVPTLLAKDMEMIAKDNRILVWSRDGHSIEATSAVVKFIGEANLVNVTAVDRDSRELKTSINAKVAPIAFALNPAYPNPFNPNTNLSFTLPEALSYNLKIYNVVGQLVRSYEGIGKVGLNVITWDSRDNTGDEVASGIYFYKLTAGSFSATQKMVVMK